MAELLKCSVLHTRHIIIPNCKDAPEHCKRTYHILLPKILCDGTSRHLEDEILRRGPVNEYEDKFFIGEYRKVGTIPMVFAFHRLGSDYREMNAYSKSADDHHLAMIIPEGINQSFNAGDCCGDAHELGIHDVEFIYHIQQMLSAEFDFLQPAYSYGIGWDNGGLLLADAAIESPYLFKAIVPIAGYSTRTWTPPSIGTGIGLMMHHSLDDVKIRPSGCCHNPQMPLCQGGPVKDSCDSVLESFDTWSRTINLCRGSTERRGSKADTPKGTSGGRKTLLVGGGDGIFYSLQQDDGITSMTYVSLADGKDKEPSKDLSFSEVPLSVTYQHRDVVCLTTASDSCVANSTLCLYKEMGHFDGFVPMPDMVDQMMEFLARDACSSNEGSLERATSSGKKLCKCNGGTFNGVFCLDLGVDASLNPEEPLPNEPTTSTATQEKSPLSVVAMIGFVLMTVITIILRMRRNRRKRNSDFPASLHEDMNLAIPSMSHTNQDKLYTIDTNFDHGTPRQIGGWRIWNDAKPVPRLSRKLSEDHASDCDDKSQTFHRSGLDHSDRSEGSLSLKSLDAIDLELLQFYRKKSQGSDAVPMQYISLDDHMGLNLDLELLQSYRRRQQDRRMYGEDRDEDRDENVSIQSSSSRLSCIVQTNKNTLNDLLFMDDDLEEAGSLSHEDEEEDDGNEDAVIKSILWDVSMS